MLTRDRVRPRPPGMARVRAQAAPGTLEAPRSGSRHVWRTQVIPLHWIQNLYVVVILLVCVVLFAFTTLGNVGFFGVDLRRIADRAYWQTATWIWLWVVPMSPPIALIAGVVMQFIVQIGQFATARDKRTRAYRAWLLASVVPSAITYVPVVVDAVISGLWQAWGLWLVLFVPSAVVLTIALCAAADMAQERILVRDPSR